MAKGPASAGVTCYGVATAVICGYVCQMVTHYNKTNNDNQFLRHFFHLKLSKKEKKIIW